MSPWPPAGLSRWWCEQGFWGLGPELLAGTALQGAFPQPWWLLSLRWEDRRGHRGVQSGTWSPHPVRVVVSASVAHSPPSPSGSFCGFHRSLSVDRGETCLKVLVLWGRMPV